MKSSSMIMLVVAAIAMMATIASASTATQVIQLARYGYSDSTCTTTTPTISVSAYEIIGACTPNGGNGAYKSYWWSVNTTTGVYTRKSWDTSIVCGDKANSTITTTLGACTSYNGYYYKFKQVNNTVDGSVTLIQTTSYEKTASCGNNPTAVSFTNIAGGLCVFGFKFTIESSTELTMNFYSSDLLACTGSSSASYTYTEGQCYGDSDDTTSMKYSFNAGVKTQVGSMVIMAMLATLVSMMW